jgi:hypothetical protein
VPEERLIAVGYGETHPQVAEMTDMAREQNRRIEIKLNNGEFHEVVGKLPDTVPRTALIDVNRASARDLMVLPGMTPELARSVVDYRARAGRITSFEDLSQVRGFDPQKMSAIGTMVTFGGENDMNRSTGSGTPRDNDMYRVPRDQGDQDMNGTQKNSGETSPGDDSSGQ